MNPHFHHPPYPEMNSPHSPHPDGIPAGYHGHGPPQGPPTANGHIMGPHHDHIHPHPAFTGGGIGPPGHHPIGPGSLHHHHLHHHHYHMMNSNSGGNANNSGSGSSNNGPGGNNSGNSNNSSSNSGQNCSGNDVKICGGCGAKIMERYLLFALDRYWHHGCLKCEICGAMLAELGTSCYTRSDMILCKTDYIRMFGSTGACSGCGQTIPASELVMRAGGPLLATSGGVPTSSPGTAAHHVFHLNCFTCSKCGGRLVPGDRYYLLSGSLVCEQDWHKLFGKSGPVNAGNQTASGTTTVRKGKVGRPRRTRE